MGVTPIELGGAALADPAYEPDGYVLDTVTIGDARALASGALVLDYVSFRYKFTLRWKAITEGEKDIIRGKAETTGTQALVTPDNVNYTVYVVPNSWKENYIESGGARYYNCELQLEEST